jgi:hypothetical protein
VFTTNWPADCATEATIVFHEDRHPCCQLILDDGLHPVEELGLPFGQLVLHRLALEQLQEDGEDECLHAVSLS